MSEDYVSDIMPENTGERHVACVLCVDVSGSMSGEPIEELNQGLIEFGEALQADALAYGRVEVAIVKFSNNAEVELSMIPARQYQAPKLKAGGMTSMNAAIDLGLDIIDDRKKQYRALGVSYYRPWLFVLTDGYPTDKENAYTVRTRLQDEIRNKKVIYMPMGIGSGADKATLQSYYPDELEQGKKIVLKATQNHFKDAFTWISSSLSEVSKSNPQVTNHINTPPLPAGIAIEI